MLYTLLSFPLLIYIAAILQLQVADSVLWVVVRPGGWSDDSLGANLYKYRILFSTCYRGRKYESYFKNVFHQEYYLLVAALLNLAVA